MPDLDKAAKLFQASTRLQRASSALERIALGNSVDSADKDALRWAGEFLPQLDLDHPVGQGVSGNLAVQAATARPTYYSSLAKVAPLFEGQGVIGEELRVFFLALYEFLRRGEATDESTLPSARLLLAASLLHELSAGLLVSSPFATTSRWKM